MKLSPGADEITSACRVASTDRPARSRKLMVSGALVLLSGCAATMTYAAAMPYFYDDEFPPSVVDDKTRVVSMEKAPISPVKFGQWFIPSGWAVALAARWTDLPYVFDADGPEYCTALGVDKDRMLHASPVVRYRAPKDAKEFCPRLIWKDDLFMVMLGSTHSHSSLEHQGERISAQDASLRIPMLVGEGSEARIEMSHVAVQFFSGARLIGVDPATGRKAPVPAQFLLFTRFNFVPHVFLWTSSDAGAGDKIRFARVYKPAPDDGWEEVGICWANAAELRQATTTRSSPPAHCNPDDFWLK